MMLLLAQAAPGAPGPSGSPYAWVINLLPIAAIVLIFWFLVFRPERQKQKKRKEMIESIGRNDKVVTIGGIHGIVKTISDTEVMLLVDEKRDVTLKFNRSAIYAKLTGEEKGELAPPQN